MLSLEQLLSGKSQGPDPTDTAKDVPLASGAADVQECSPIEEEDSSEYEESSDEQQ